MINMDIFSKFLLFHFIAFLCYSPLNMSAQTSVDSLLNVVKHAEGEAKYSALKAISKHYRSSDPEKSLKFSEQEKMQAVAMHNRSLEAEAMIQIYLYQIQNNQAEIRITPFSTFPGC